MNIQKGKNARKLVEELYDKKKVLSNFESELENLIIFDK